MSANPFLPQTSASFESDDDDGGDDLDGTPGVSTGHKTRQPTVEHPLPPGATTVELRRPNVETSFGFSLGCDQATGVKWVKRVAPGGIADGKLRTGQQVLVANGAALLPLSHRDAVMILKDKVHIALVVCGWLEGAPVAAPVAPAAAMSYIEMMCADEREDNALARSILQSPAATALEPDIFDQDRSSELDQKPVYENWSTPNDGSGALFTVADPSMAKPSIQATATAGRLGSTNPFQPAAAVAAGPTSFVPPKFDADITDRRGTVDAHAYENWGGGGKRADRGPSKPQYENWPRGADGVAAAALPAAAEATASPQRGTSSGASLDGKDAAPKKTVTQADAAAAQSTYADTERMMKIIHTCVHGKPAERKDAVKSVNLQAYLALTQKIADKDDESSITAVEVGRTAASGLLKKEGAVRKNWKERWFELDLNARAVKYYANKTRAVLKGGILLQEVLCATLSPDPSEKGKRSFSVVCDTRTYNLTADSQSTVRIWVALFNALGKDPHGKGSVASGPRRRETITEAPIGFGVR